MCIKKCSIKLAEQISSDGITGMGDHSTSGKAM